MLFQQFTNHALPSVKNFQDSYLMELETATQELKKNYSNRALLPSFPPSSSHQIAALQHPFSRESCLARLKHLQSVYTTLLCRSIAVSLLNSREPVISPQTPLSNLNPLNSGFPSFSNPLLTSNSSQSIYDRSQPCKIDK